MGYPATSSPDDPHERLAAPGALRPVEVDPLGTSAGVIACPHFGQTVSMQARTFVGSVFLLRGIATLTAPAA